MYINFYRNDKQIPKEDIPTLEEIVDIYKESLDRIINGGEIDSTVYVHIKNYLYTFTHDIQNDKIVTHLELTVNSEVDNRKLGSLHYKIIDKK